MRGIHAGQQDRGDHAVAQQADARPDAQGHRDDEREQAEDEALDLVLAEVLHVHLQACKEHYVVKPHLAEELEAAVPFKDIEPVLPYCDAGKDHPYDVGNFQFAEDNGSEKDDDQHYEEDPNGVCHWKCHKNSRLSYKFIKFSDSGKCSIFAAPFTGKDGNVYGKDCGNT